MDRKLSATTHGVLWLAALLPLLGWWATGLFDLDEGFYAAVVSEMLRRGDWITPHYNGVPWFEKPILLYWLAAPTVAVFGQEWGPRLPGVLCSVALFVVVFFQVRKRMGESAAAWAVALLSGSLLVVGAGRMMLTDPPYVLALTTAFFAFYGSLTDDVRWRVPAGALLGLAVLGKGPVSGVLFVLIFGILYALRPELRKGYRGMWLPGIAAFLAMVCCWYVPAYLANGDVFVQKFLIEQNIGRLTGGDEAHTYRGVMNWFFYVVILIAGCFPWILKFPWVRGIQPGGKGDAFVTLCWIWFWVVFTLFTISAAKLPHYILPALPPLAILVGAKVAEWKARSPGRFGPLEGFAGSVIGRVVLCVLANVAMWDYYHGADLALAGQRLVVPGAHAEVHRLARHLRPRQGEVAVFQMPRRQKSRGTGTPNLQETSHPSIVFYLGRPVRLSETVDDLVRQPVARWVLTRKGRMTPEVSQQLAVSGLRLEAVPVTPSVQYYELYELIPTPKPQPMPKSP